MAQAAANDVLFQLNTSVPAEVLIFSYWYIVFLLIDRQDLSILAEDIDHRSLAERRPRRENRQLPRRFKDVVPQALPLLPATTGVSAEQEASTVPSQPTTSISTSSLPSRVLRIFRTPRNVFGLFRQYFADKLPSHDPEEHVDLQDLSDSCENAGNALRQRQRASDNFYPYPNENSFCLGDWYWNHGIQKSRESFRQLLSIVGDPGFCPDDVRGTQWSKIDAKLAINDFDEEKGADDDWMDEDAGWMRTPVRISVPFAKRHTKQPGPRTFVVGDLYHRSFVSVIREKLANPKDDRYFHYEPFELFWRRPDTGNDTRVHGELYTSPAFLDAHNELQESPPEPGCSLPRVIVAMMFWSDATQLTSFGTAKLWPAYLSFGNESKYRRCKPSCHLSNHVAYFQSVGHFFNALLFFLWLLCVTAPRLV